MRGLGDDLMTFHLEHGGKVCTGCGCERNAEPPSGGVFCIAEKRGWSDSRKEVVGQDKR